MHERPGVYSSYDASTVVSAGRAAKVIGVAAKAVKGTAGEVVTLTGYAAGVAAFGEDAADTPGMSTILRLLFANGASTVAAVRVAEAGAVKDYQDAFAALGGEEARILVCDSAEETVQQALRTAVEEASSDRMERIAVVGGDLIEVIRTAVQQPSGEPASPFIQLVTAAVVYAAFLGWFKHKYGG